MVRRKKKKFVSNLERKKKEKATTATKNPCLFNDAKVQLEIGV